MRKLYAKVTETEIRLQNGMAGVQGEDGASALVLSFCEAWDALGKQIVFYDAHRENPIVVLLGLDRLYGDDPHSYIVPIPKTALSFAGECLFYIEGREEASGRLMRSLCAHMIVEPCPTDAERAAAEPDEVLQFQAEIDAIKKTLVKGMINAEAVEEIVQGAQASATQAALSAERALAAYRNIEHIADGHENCYMGTKAIGTDGWIPVSGSALYEKTVTVPEARATDVPLLGVSDPAAAATMGLTACETADGALILYSERVPTRGFTVQYTLLRGVIAL